MMINPEVEGLLRVLRMHAVATLPHVLDWNVVYGAGPEGKEVRICPCFAFLYAMRDAEAEEGSREPGTPIDPWRFVLRIHDEQREGESGGGLMHHDEDLATSFEATTEQVFLLALDLFESLVSEEPGYEVYRLMAEHRKKWYNDSQKPTGRRRVSAA